MPLSNDAPVTIFSAASLILTFRSMITGTLPAPTPNDGRPEEYADLTIAPPPVATTTSTTFISSCVVSTEPLTLHSSPAARATAATSSAR